MSNLRSQFSQKMNSIFGLFPPNRIGLAVSGGVDSMALTSLTSEWARPRGIDLRAYIVDHHLRNESTDEALGVSSLLQNRFGIESKIIDLRELKSMSTKHPSKLEELAREARRNAFERECLKDQISYLMMAHHFDDQMELFVQRLLKGSSWFGLAGMHTIRPLSLVPRRPPDSPKVQPIQVIRPLLSFPKSALIQRCIDQKLRWWEDATNQDIDLTQRNLIRRMYTLQLEPKSVSRESLTTLIPLMRSQRDKSLQIATRVLKHLKLSKSLQITPKEGTAELIASEELKLLPLMALREVLYRIIAQLSPLPASKISMRRSKVDAVAALMKSSMATSKAHLNVMGVEIHKGHHKSASDKWTFNREPPRRTEFNRVDVYTASKEWSDWTLIDNRLYMRWRLPMTTAGDTFAAHSNSMGEKYFSIRLIQNPLPILKVMSSTWPKSTLARISQDVYKHPLFMWSSSRAPHLASTKTIIGFPTKGIVRGLEVQVTPKICYFEG